MTQIKKEKEKWQTQYFMWKPKSLGTNQLNVSQSQYQKQSIFMYSMLSLDTSAWILYYEQIKFFSLQMN